MILYDLCGFVVKKMATVLQRYDGVAGLLSLPHFETKSEAIRRDLTTKARSICVESQEYFSDQGVLFFEDGIEDNE